MDASWARVAYGEDAPARGILLSLYMTIALASALLLVLFRFEEGYLAVVVGLLLVQITYKLTTPFTVGAIDHPVVVSNLLIAAFHSVTCTFIVHHVLANRAEF